MLKDEDETRISANAQKAVQEFVATYNKVTDEVIRAKIGELVSSNMKHGEYQDSYFMETTLARPELGKMGESISDRRFLDCFVLKGPLRNTRTSR